MNDITNITFLPDALSIAMAWERMASIQDPMKKKAFIERVASEIRAYSEEIHRAYGENSE